MRRLRKILPTKIHPVQTRQIRVRKRKPISMSLLWKEHQAKIRYQTARVKETFRIQFRIRDFLLQEYVDLFIWIFCEWYLVFRYKVLYYFKYLIWLLRKVRLLYTRTFFVSSLFLLNVTLRLMLWSGYLILIIIESVIYKLWLSCKTDHVINWVSKTSPT